MENENLHTDTEVKRYVGVVLEEVRTGFKVANEYCMGINERLDTIDKTLESHTEQIGALLMDSTEIKSKLNKLQLDVNLDLEGKVDKEHFVDLELRVRKLEKK